MLAALPPFPISSPSLVRLSAKPPYRHPSLSTPMLSPNGLMSMLVDASTFYPSSMQTLPFASGSRPIPLFHVPCRWQLPADYRATCIVIISPRPQTPFCALSCFASLRCPPPLSPGSPHKRTRAALPAEMNGFYFLPPAPACQKRIPPYKFFFLAFPPLLLLYHLNPPCGDCGRQQAFSRIVA
jgi:hypothetical protein